MMRLWLDMIALLGWLRFMGILRMAHRGRSCHGLSAPSRRNLPQKAPRGPVRSVVRGARASLPGRRGVLVTNRGDGDAATIIRLARPRWPPDTCAQDRQGPLGCHEDRRRSAEAMGQHGGLVVVAASRRHVTCLPAAPDRTRGLLHTHGDAWRQQGHAVRQNRWGFAQDPWSHGATLDQLCGPIVAKQRGLVLG